MFFKVTKNHVQLKSEGLLGTYGFEAERGLILTYCNEGPMFLRSLQKSH